MLLTKQPGPHSVVQGGLLLLLLLLLPWRRYTHRGTRAVWFDGGGN